MKNGPAGPWLAAALVPQAGLRRLALNANRISEVGKRVLLASPYLQQLHALETRENWTPPIAFRR